MTLGELLSELPKLPRALYDDAMQWCAEGRVWILRLPPMAYMLWVFWQHLHSSLDEYAYYDMFSRVNLPVHEGGHKLFGYFGEFLMVAGGHLSEMLFVFVLIGGFIKQRDYFGVCFMMSWLASVYYGMAVYMADARSQVLELVTIGEAEYITHDWNFMLDKFGLLQQDKSLAKLVHLAGHGLSFIGICAGVFLIFRMIWPAEEDSNQNTSNIVKL